jgi:hypothetical protein
MSLDLDNVTQRFLRIGKGLIGVLAGMLAFLLVIVPIFMIRGCETDEGTDKARRLERLEILEESKQQEEDLRKLEFIDQQAGTVHLPIENAMAATILDLQGQEVQDSGVSAANWAPPQLPSWADAPPLYTLTTQEQIQAQQEAAPQAQPETETETETAEPAEGEGESAEGDNAEPSDPAKNAETEAVPQDDAEPAAEAGQTGEQPVETEEPATRAADTGEAS